MYKYLIYYLKFDFTKKKKNTTILKLDIFKEITTKYHEKQGS